MTFIQSNHFGFPLISVNEFLDFWGVFYAGHFVDVLVLHHPTELDTQK